MITRRCFLASSAAACTLAQAAPASASFQLDPRFVPQEVPIRRGFTPGEIMIVPRAHYLYLITGPYRAIRYGVGVGKAGLEFKGTATIDVKKKWPTWRPTEEMIERSPKTYGRFKDNDYVQPGGPKNPLGARALYLFQNGRDTYFRIHGTTQPDSIGRSVSNGCIRMINEHVMDLYERVPIGTVVKVV